MAATVATTTKSTTVDASLWFNSFTHLLTDLENLSLTSDPPPSLVEKLKANHTWFLNTVNQFKPPSQSSKNALNAEQIVIGSNNFKIKPQLKQLALKLSSTVLLDEVQSYIFVERTIDHSTQIVDGLIQGLLYEVVLQYYTERQCLLKCARQMIVHALHIGSAVEQETIILVEVRKLILDGLENKLISILSRHISSSHPQHMDLDLFILWAEDMLIEDNLVLDILFLAYYESFCSCTAAKWKELCLLYKDMTGETSNFRKLGVSNEACKYYNRAKIQTLLILIETLDFENLLQMIHDEIPLRSSSSVFSSSDILAMDSVISDLDIFVSKEVGPLILAWAVFLCLVTSLPGKEDYNELTEIDHVGYVRQAFEYASLNLFLEILQSDVLNDSDGPVAGYRSILRTFSAAFIASYEINYQLEDDTFRHILAILCEIYQGEESLCIQFWDKRSIVDGPIRALLCNLENEFPSRSIELARFLSALSEGCWPADCVYNFLKKSVGISSIIEIGGDLSAGGPSQIVELQSPLQVPSVQGLFIPSKTRGRVLRMIDSKTALVRWEYKQSGVLILLLRLAQLLDLDGSEEVLVVLGLFSHLASANTAVCFSLMNIGESLHLQTNYDDGQMESNICCTINTVEVLCNLVRNLSPYSGSVLAMSMGVNILAKMMRCSPSHVSEVVMKVNIFDLSLKTSIFSDQNDGLSSGSWLLSGRLAKMMLIDCEHNPGCPLTVSVLDFTVQLMEAGVENDFVFALAVFCLQYVFVNHELWKYKLKKDRWNVTLKVLGVLKISVMSIPYLKVIGGKIRDVILSDSSIHSMIFRIVCTTSPALEKLYISKLYDWRDIDGLQHALSSMLEILRSILSNITEDDSCLPVFHQAVLSSSTKPIPVVEALSSLISYTRSPDIQLGAVEALSMLCLTADRSQPYLSGSTNLSLGGKQVIHLRSSIENIIGEQYGKNEDLFVAIVKLLTSAANYQPTFFVAILADDDFRAADDQTNDSTSQNNVSETAMHLVDMLVVHVHESNALTERNPRVLLSVLEFVKALWEGAVQYIDVLGAIRKSKKFWEQLSGSILLISCEEAPKLSELSQADTLKMAYKYRCQSAALDIMALELFMHKKLLHAESDLKCDDTSFKGKFDQVARVNVNIPASGSPHLVEDIFISWSGSSALCDLLKSCSASFFDTDIYRHAKIAFGLLAAHLIGKLAAGNAGSLCVSLVEAITALSTELINLPAFLELCNQYRGQGYSEGIQIRNLIHSDLYYHLQGELEGRNIQHGAFNELFQFLVGPNLMGSYVKTVNKDFRGDTEADVLFDVSRLRHDIGVDYWDYSEWEASTKIADTLLFHLQEANFMLSLVRSRLPALRALIRNINMNMGKSAGRDEGTFLKVNKDGFLSSIEHICKELQSTIKSLTAATEAPQEVLDYVVLMAELLLCLVRYVGDCIPTLTCLVILKACSSGVKGLSESGLLVVEVKQSIRFLLLLLHMVVESSSQTTSSTSSDDYEHEAPGKVSHFCLGLLPSLCSYTDMPDQLIISLATIDIIIKRLLTPSSWFPIIQRHLQLQLLILKLHDKKCFETLPVILKFLVTLASVRGGAEMIVASGFLSSLKILMSEISNNSIANWIEEEKSTKLGDKIEKPQFLWGLGLAVLVAIVNSLGETTLCVDVVDSITSYFFSEKAYLIAYHLSAPDFPSDNHDKKRARGQKRQASLYSFRETEHTLMLICVLAKHRNSWMKVIKEMGSELRQRNIHLLAFISRRAQLFAESPSRPLPFVCAPISKEENDYCRRPSFVNSRRGWFSAITTACIPVADGTVELLKTAIVIRGPANGHSDLTKPTYYSDTVAVQLYRIAFLILEFLCLQADDAARRAEELGSIDLSHFPELPDPEILHGLQDQTLAIVTEVCDANKSKTIQSDAQGVCLLLLKILEMALYLEFCVSQICGIRPVMGQIEDFSKQMRMLARATEGHTFLKPSMKHVKQIVAFMYPGLLQSEGIL